MSPEPRDRKGVPIKKGDLLRSNHFTHYKRKRKCYLYHVVVGGPKDGYLEMVPFGHLAHDEKTNKIQGGKCWLKAILDDHGVARDAEVVADSDYGSGVMFFERVKLPVPTPNAKD